MWRTVKKFLYASFVEQINTLSYKFCLNTIENIFFLLNNIILNGSCTCGHCSSQVHTH